MSLYNDLEIILLDNNYQSISQKQIKKAFRTLSKIYHPDKNVGDSCNNNEERYKKIVAAYEILSNQEKKQLYDQSLDKDREREQKCEQQREQNNFQKNSFQKSLFDFLFSMMVDIGKERKEDNKKEENKKKENKQKDFPAQSTSSTFQKKDRENKLQPQMIKEVIITLEDFYNCTEKNFEITIQQNCLECNDKQNWQRNNSATTCQPCNICKGEHKLCNSCDSTGLQFVKIDPDPSIICCQGKKYTLQKKCIKIKITPWMNISEPIDIFLTPHNMQKENILLLRIFLLFENVEKVATFPFYSPLKYPSSSSPPTFDIELNLKISVFQSLGNLKHSHQHLDGKEYIFIYKGLIDPENILVAKGLGLPKRKDEKEEKNNNNNEKRGDLLIKFKIEWSKKK
jgi:DnaJ-class molecular chaperone